MTKGEKEKMSKLNTFLRKADQKTDKRFSSPFFPYYEDHEGNIVWIADLSDEAKRKILKRAGREEG